MERLTLASSDHKPSQDKIRQNKLLSISDGNIFYLWQE
ncbi:hypothetical protein STRDD13_00455 [Streptococcus sp. DD13]|nr:hypothetical protein STRDD13_00455 [Streptococcus sp. DD13]